MLGKGWRAFGETSVVPPQEAAGSLTALTPQVPPPAPELMADKPGVAQYQLSRKVFKAELNSLRTCIGAGTLHTRYETIKATAKYGGEASLYNIAFAVPRSGGLHPDLAAELTHLRALCVYKPDGSHRPLGLPESETRFFLACVAAQEKPAWDAFYTSPLPCDRAAQARDIEHAKQAVAHARAREAQAVACYQEGTPIDACCAAAVVIGRTHTKKCNRFFTAIFPPDDSPYGQSGMSDAVALSITVAEFLEFELYFETAVFLRITPRQLASFKLMYPNEFANAMVSPVGRIGKPPGRRIVIAA